MLPFTTYESPEWVTVNAARDANLNGDSAGDRAIFNPSGARGIGADVTTLFSTNNCSSLPTSQQSSCFAANLNVTERMKFHVGAQAANILNHPQYIVGSDPGRGLGVNDVSSFNTTKDSYLAFLTPGNANFNIPKTTFGSSARQLSLVAKFIF